ncbi:TonB-dependent receptor domain-containing protein [Alkalilimnicola sp. S0819]|uniref:TonB-dependent receptor domain-containing protein n=1 Tax=Alkalilimnicola sp. S0819 TaxID=2613922 RepID=UPI001261B55C|nr:TonB-dependent receptor [Alkalilimnicola sp. S0819]KAB7623383.1 TonB-dependent receptor [Alkalilimnicola sp. S0819]MPQ16925.1 TonB-dependent receptor [Alkalilimnicola sp. S0819]
MHDRFISALLLAGAASATAASASEQRLDPVVVTASRVAQTSDEAMAAVTVVDRQAIERLQPRSLVDLLRTQPSIDISRNGGPGGNTSVFLRGAQGDHTLVLVDGVRASSATTGQFNWNSLSPDQVERIEIVRGPRAALYGSDAIGGVIQIFTRRGQGLSADVEAGSYQTRSGRVSYGGGSERLHFDISAAASQSDGFSATNPDAFSYHPDNDGFEQQSVSTQLRGEFTDNLSASLRLWHSEGESEFDQGRIDDRNQTVDARLDWAVTDDWSQRLQLGQALDRSETASTSPSTIKTRRRSLDWQHDLGFGQHLLVAGLSHWRDSARNTDDRTGATVFDEDTHNSAAYMNLLLDWGRHDLEIGLRHDEHSEFGGHTTGALAWGLDLSPRLRLVSSYATAFKAPTLNELYHPGFGGFFAGNPDLDPEQSETGEISLRYRPTDEQRLAATVFYTEVEDLIEYDGPLRQASNIGLARLKGLELEYSAQLDAWWWQASATLQRAEDAQANERLPRRAEKKLALVLGRKIGRGEIQADLQLVGDRVDRNDDLAGYGLLNLSASYPLYRGLALTARIENAGDKDYTLAHGYNTPGRSYFLGLRYSPEQ